MLEAIGEWFGAGPRKRKLSVLIGAVSEDVRRVIVLVLLRGSRGLFDLDPSNSDGRHLLFLLLWHLSGALTLFDGKLDLLPSLPLLLSRLVEVGLAIGHASLEVRYSDGSPDVASVDSGTSFDRRLGFGVVSVSPDLEIRYFGVTELGANRVLAGLAEEGDGGGRSEGGQGGGLIQVLPVCFLDGSSEVRGLHEVLAVHGDDRRSGSLLAAVHLKVTVGVEVHDASPVAVGSVVQREG